MTRIGISVAFAISVMVGLISELAVAQLPVSIRRVLATPYRLSFAMGVNLRLVQFNVEMSEA